MASDCEPAASLTEEQRERIATNKAAALARLAKARSLAAWASQPPHSVMHEQSQKLALVQSSTAQVSLSSKLSVLVQEDNYTEGQLPNQGQMPQCSTGVAGNRQVAPTARKPSGHNSTLLTGRQAVATVRVAVNSVVGVVMPGGIGAHPGPTGGLPTCNVQAERPEPALLALHLQSSKGGGKVRKSPSKALQSILQLKRTLSGEAEAGSSNGARGLLETPSKTARLGTPTKGKAPSVTVDGVRISGSKSVCSEGLKQSKRLSVDGAAKAALDIFANAGSVARNSEGHNASTVAQRGPLKAERAFQTLGDNRQLVADRGTKKSEMGVSNESLGPLTVCSGANANSSELEKGPSTGANGAGSSNVGDANGGVDKSAALNRGCPEAAVGMEGGSVAGVAVGPSKGEQKKLPFLQWPKQEFDYFLVIDFECTCDNVANFDPAEIIEFPSVLLNARTLRIEDSFRVFCRPQVHSTLTPFCTQLTGIQQDQVDAGVSLQEALAAHDTWLRSKNLLDKPNRFAVVTWTDWDCKVMLEMECKWKRIQKPAYFNRWINLKLPFAKVFPKAKGTCHGLKGHITYAGVTWEGRAHSGLDDATNTARLAAALIRQGGKLTITDSFKIYAADGSKVERVLRKRPLVQADGNAREGPVANGQGGKCHCGVKRKRRTVKKPGPTHGQTFFSCGKWTITAGGCCEYFEWVQDGDSK